MKTKFNSLFVKLPLFMVIFLILLLSAVGSYLYYETLNRYTASLEKMAPELAAKVAFTTKELLWHFDTDGVKSILKFEMNNPSVKSISLSTINGTVDVKDSQFIAFERIDGKVKSATTDPKGDYIVAKAAIVFRDEQIGSVKVFLSEKHLKANFISRVREIVLFCIVIIILAIIVILLQLKFLILTPMKRIMTAINKIQRGDLSIRIPVVSKDEFGELSHAFNKSVEIRQDTEIQLKTTNDELRNLVYVASHDLRVPLVNISGYSTELMYSLEDLDRLDTVSAKDCEQLTEIVNTVRQDCSDSVSTVISSVKIMGKLVDGLLKLSRTGQREISRKSLSMNTLCKQVLESQKKTLTTQNIQVEVDDLPECYGDEVEMFRVMQNLIANAVKYRDKTRVSTVKIGGNKDENFSTYSVSDNGIGIREREAEKVFTSFYRSKVKGVEGDGIGLSVTKIIIMKHRGKIWVESEPGKGSTFFFRVPHE